MSKQRDREIENAQRREEAKRKRTERVVTGYVKICHPEIYAKAYEFYQHLDALYPGKRDLRKTTVFLSLKSEHTRSVNKPVKRVRVHHTAEKTTTDNMVLHIPLMQRKTTTVQETTEETATVQETTEETVTVQETTEETTTDLLPIDDNILEEIMADLREDPDIQRFFDDLDFQHDDCPLW